LVFWSTELPTELPESCEAQNRGFISAAVWQIYQYSRCVISSIIYPLLLFPCSTSFSNTFSDCRVKLDSCCKEADISKKSKPFSLCLWIWNQLWRIHHWTCNLRHLTNSLSVTMNTGNPIPESPINSMLWCFMNSRSIDPADGAQPFELVDIPELLLLPSCPYLSVKDLKFLSSPAPWKGHSLGV
jgi:hypothetical protein